MSFAPSELTLRDFVVCALIVAAGIAGCITLRLRDASGEADEARKVQAMIDDWKLTAAEIESLL